MSTRSLFYLGMGCGAVMVILLIAILMVAPLMDYVDADSSRIAQLEQQTDRHENTLKLMARTESVLLKRLFPIEFGKDEDDEENDGP